MGFLEIDEEIVLNVDTINTIEKKPILVSNVDIEKETTNSEIRISTNQGTLIITNQKVEHIPKEHPRLKRFEPCPSTDEEKVQYLIKKAKEGQHEAYTKIVSAMSRALKSKGELVCLSLKQLDESSK